MPKNNNSALTYPDWSRVGKEPDKGRNLTLPPDGDVACDHHIGEDLPDIPETEEEKKAHRAEIKAMHAEQDERGFDLFAHEVADSSLGKGLTILIWVVVILAVILYILSAVGILPG